MVYILVNIGGVMKLSESVKPISYLKAHASELIREVSENKKTLVITLNGEAKAIVQDLESYEQMQDSLALLKILAQSSKSKTEGRYKPVKKTFRDLRSRIKDLK
jgi:prevent-host-death family protein